MEELAEEENLVWLVVAKVEYMVVEMVEKVVVDMGYLVEKKRKKKVVKMVLWLLLLLGWRRRWRRKRWWNWWWKWRGECGDWPAKGGSKMTLWLLPFAGNKGEEEEIMKERERNGVYI